MGGPFRLCRNPNYLGSLLQYVGLLLPPSAALGRAAPLAATGLALFMAIEWIPNMAAKDASLARQHGTLFAVWSTTTPRFVPTAASTWRAVVGWWWERLKARRERVAREEELMLKMQQEREEAGKAGGGVRRRA